MKDRQLDAKMKQLAEDFKKELPAEYIQHIKENADYILEFFKPVPVSRDRVSNWMTAKRSAEIENASIEVLNKYYTGLLREKL